MENMIEVNHLVKTFGDVHAVDGISFNVKPGEFFGFLGINGAGKSTTINMLCTLFPHTSGDATICGHTLGKDNAAIRREIGVVFQNNTLDLGLTIKENLLTRAYLYDGHKKNNLKKVNDIAERLEIGDLMHAKFQDLSGGQKRRCELARALIHRPQILFLDEPTTGLDPKTKQLVWQCIETLRKDFNTTVFLTTHYMEEAAQAEHIAVMDQGKIIADASPFKLKELYSSDKLRVEVKDEQALFQILEHHHLAYQAHTNCIEIELASSLSAIPILGQLEPHISAFEVIQGTMEDAFLNLTGKSKEEVVSNANSSNAYEAKHKALYA